MIGSTWTFNGLTMLWLVAKIKVREMVFRLERSRWAADASRAPCAADFSQVSSSLLGHNRNVAMTLLRFSTALLPGGSRSEQTAKQAFKLHI